MGEQAAVDFWRAQDMSFDMVLITRDGRVVYTPGLADCFNEKDGTASVYQMCIRDRTKCSGQTGNSFYNEAIRRGTSAFTF